MTDVTATGLVEMTADEAVAVDGGNIPLAGFIAMCFGAGFNFGFTQLGPMICG